MKIQPFTKYLGGLLLFLFCAAIEIHAQPRPGGGGGFGGFGGFGGGGFDNFNRNNTASTSSSYNNNGTVGNATFAVDPDTHSIVVIADEQTAAQIQQVINNLDRPKPQVLIKVVFLEVQHNNSEAIGFEGGWSKGIGNSVTGSVANVFGLNGMTSVVTNLTGIGQPLNSVLVPATGGAAGFYQIIGSDFQATLRAIAAAGKAELLSRPSILTRDGQPATITIGQEVPLITGVSYYTSGGSTIPILTPNYTSVGIILKVTPFISSEGLIEMILQPSISSVDPTLTQTIAPGVTTPYLDVRSADTVVVTPDSQTVVIGGLMENNKSSNDSKVPFLGDIPILGNLFKSKSSASIKQELLIFLTPHIVGAPAQLVALTGHETHETTIVTNSFSEQELDRFLEQVPVKKPAKNTKP